MHATSLKLDDVGREILALLMQGKTAAEIGAVVHRSSRTIEHRIALLRGHYKAKNVKHLVSILGGGTLKEDSAPTEAAHKSAHLIKLLGSGTQAGLFVEVILREIKQSQEFWNEVKSIIDHNN